MAETEPEHAPQTERPVRDPWLPCLLAWLFPGLGHFILGKRHRAIVFCIVVLATLALGIGSDGTAAVMDRQKPLSYLATFDNVALGPLDLVGRYLTFGRIVYRMPSSESDPVRIEMVERLRARVRSVTFEYGSTFFLTAGLMNILLILDVFDISMGRKD